MNAQKLELINKYKRQLLNTDDVQKYKKNFKYIVINFFVNIITYFFVFVNIYSKFCMKNI